MKCLRLVCSVLTSRHKYGQDLAHRTPIESVKERARQFSIAIRKQLNYKCFLTIRSLGKKLLDLVTRTAIQIKYLNSVKRTDEYYSPFICMATSVSMRRLFGFDGDDCHDDIDGRFCSVQWLHRLNRSDCTVWNINKLVDRRVARWPHKRISASVYWMQFNLNCKQKRKKNSRKSEHEPNVCTNWKVEQMTLR